MTPIVLLRLPRVFTGIYFKDARRFADYCRVDPLWYYLQVCKYSNLLNHSFYSLQRAHWSDKEHEISQYQCTLGSDKVNGKVHETLTLAIIDNTTIIRKPSGNFEVTPILMHACAERCTAWRTSARLLVLQRMQSTQHCKCIFFKYSLIGQFVEFFLLSMKHL